MNKSHIKTVGVGVMDHVQSPDQMELLQRCPGLLAAPMEGVSSSYKVFGMTAFLEKYQENLRQMGHFHLDHFAVFEGRHPRVVVCHLPQAVVDMHAAFSPEVVPQTRKEPDPKDPHHQSVWLVRGKKRGELSLFHLNRSLEEFPATQGEITLQLYMGRNLGRVSLPLLREVCRCAEWLHTGSAGPSSRQNSCAL
jgi:hypothetical protein